MTTIQLKTNIKSPIKDVFDLSRNIDFHTHSAKKTNENVIAGKASGLIELHETVTWRGKHFGVYLTHQSAITALKYPHNFTDEMIQGHFKSFKHQHLFQDTISGTQMIDILEYDVPFGIFGKVFNYVFLKKHLTLFLITRNRAIKSHLETKK
ncbi:SRPBCC family protein [Aquimarina sp. AU474]|uniref:SRPBCC family protein n=1 Tax=Aquimarina sp. AU474 TaxID=2108529 RepID=UPI000D68C47D|nr:SRPBCC family protein [Aquimarina sp. AU474]